MKTAVITGATSMLGCALIEKCIKEKVPVFAVINPDSKRLDKVPENDLVRVIPCALEKMKELPALIPEKAVDGIFYHLAWASTSHKGREDVRAQIDNISYTADAVEAAKELGCRRFLFAGSQAEYGLCDKPLTPDTPTFPETPYGIAKLAAGKLGGVLCEQNGMEHIRVRILSAYGPGDGERTLISSLIRSLKNGEHFSTTEGRQIWDFIYKDDVAEALFLLGGKGISGKVYPVGLGKGRPLREYIETVRDLLSPGTSVGFGEVPYREGQVMHLEADITELTKDTGFIPRVSFEEGIRKTAEEF